MRTFTSHRAYTQQACRTNHHLQSSAVDPALLRTDALARIEAEATTLDIETAGAIALAALDHILATD